ncbi:MAG: hypothetical protein ACT4P1_10735 [Sporichthyaceae bacterium]
MTADLSTRSLAPTADRAKTIWRGLAALITLAALAIGPPTALITFVGNPVPDHAVIGGQLTDTAVIGMLAAVLWAAWAQLMLAVAVEAVAAIRGAALSRRIPFTGLHQHLARHLVLAIAFMFAGSSTLAGATVFADPAVAAATPCSPSVASVYLTSHQESPAASQPAATSLPAASGHLSGGPTAEARPDERPGRTNANGADLGSSEPAGRWYEVKPPRGSNHDTLWDIAERHLGDGLRWKEVYALNKGRSQPSGGELELARLIHPGWRLLLPPDATGLAESGGGGHATDRPARATARSDAETERTGQRLAPPVGERDAVPLASPDPVSSAPAPAPKPATESRTADGRSTGAEEPLAAADQDGGVPIGALTLGLGALACAGLTAELARRRRRAQRLRQPGERLRRPGSEAAGVEAQLRAANVELTVMTLRDALRTLADTCHQGGRPLPDLHTVQISPTRLTLNLGAAEPDAVPPFAATGPRTWTLRPAAADGPHLGARTGEDEERGDAADAVDPYPALVAVGVTEGTILLVNLEAAGTLRVVGPSEESARIVHAFAAELGTSALAHSAELVLTGCPPRLAGIADPGRVRNLGSDAGRRWAIARQRAVGALLVDAGLPDLLAARAHRRVADAWAPAVLIEDAPAAHESSVSPCALTAPSHGGVCVVTTRPPVPGERPGWTLTAVDRRWRLDPAGIDLDPQHFDPACLDQCEDMLSVAVDPAPAPNGETAEPPTPEVGRIPAPAAGEPSRALSITVMNATDARTTGASPTDLSVLAAAIPDAPHSTVPPDDMAEAVALPRVLVLGPVEIVGVVDEAQPGRRRRVTELIAYLALHPGASQHQLDEALWPGVRVSRNTRNPLVSRARSWLGVAADGQPYVSLVGEGQQYDLRPEVSCDWHDFRALAKRGLAAGATGLDDLTAALDLVRGRPFLGVNPAAYGWAEADAQDMISAIVDVAHALAEGALTASDQRRARWAAAKGLSVEPCAELLYQDAIRIAHSAGDGADVERLVASLRRNVADLDPGDDVTLDTSEILAALAGA